jgi:hypothetical protein
VEVVKLLAKIEKAEVVEYRRPFSLARFLEARNGGIFKIEKSAMYELCTPQVLYLWTLY